MTKDGWHYPRADFARKIYDLLTKGPIQGVTLFGPRRTGKTEFLRRDLAPLAASEGHRVVYANLWQTMDTPLAVLLYELDQALRSGSVIDRIRSISRALMPKLQLKTPDGSGDLQIDLSELQGKAPDSHLLLMDQYCEQLANPKKPALLLLDEFQELARTSAAAPLIAALRTSLDKRSDGLVAVFTGSSQAGLRRVFSARQAPFFRFATPLELPPLTEDFVDHQLMAVKATSKAKVDRSQALSVFERFDRNPQFFQRWLMAIALNPYFEAEDAVDAVQAEVAEEFGYAEQWLSLKPIQRLVARLLAEQVEQIYGRSGEQRIAELGHKPIPTKSALQSAINRLSRLGLIDKWDEGWRIADPLFENWVKERPRSDFEVG